MNERDLIGYAVNSMGGDKLTNLMTILKEIVGLDEITSRAISLINPHNQYKFLEDEILRIDDCKNKLKELLKSYHIDIPIKYGWRHTGFLNGEEKLKEGEDWFDDKYDCYRAMHKTAMQNVENAIDGLDEVPITIVTKNLERITIRAGNNLEDVYELYEL
jgi:hypothetical protein